MFDSWCPILWWSGLPPSTSVVILTAIVRRTWFPCALRDLFRDDASELETTARCERATIMQNMIPCMMKWKVFLLVPGVVDSQLLDRSRAADAESQSTDSLRGLSYYLPLQRQHMKHWSWPHMWQGQLKHNSWRDNCPRLCVLLLLDISTYLYNTALCIRISVIFWKGIVKSSLQMSRSSLQSFRTSVDRLVCDWQTIYGQRSELVSEQVWIFRNMGDQK